MNYSSEGIIEEEIASRVRLYDYSTGKQTFFQWQAGMLPSQQGKSILELGCGNGAIWQDLLPRWTGSELLLTDIEADVLETAKNRLMPFAEMARQLSFDLVDFNQLPYADEQFDVVIANHNLFYAADIHLLLADIERILKPGGMLICSTIGKDHLHELIALLRCHKPDLPWGAESWANAFGLENGAQMLMEHFNHVDQFEYDNNLHVNAVDPVVSYLSRTMKGALHDWVSENSALVSQWVDQAMTDKGYFRLTPHSGFFVGYKD